MSITEVAQCLRVTRTTLYKHLSTGAGAYASLPVVRLGRHYRVRRSDLEAWIEARRVAA